MQLAAAGQDLKKLREIADVLIEKAAAGDLQAMKELFDRLDGKPAQLLEHDSPDDTPTIQFVRQIVHVTKTREELEADQDLVVSYDEIKAIGGNGHGDGNGHDN
jgi:hypothetical protein